MTDKTKRIGLIALGVVVCAALTVGIVWRFGTRPAADDPAIENPSTSDNEPVVDISETTRPELNIQISDGSDTETANPAAGADSDGTEQTIQADPVKPDAPEPPSPTEENHDANSVPEEDRNTETPPTYKPEQTTVTPPSTEPQGGSTNSQGQMYVPGFGYIDGGGESTGTVNEGMYENGNKVGIMD